MPRWKIGELAKRMGLTGRTLHHYDHVGLLTPSERSEAGYRLYGSEDVRRLTAIVLLRGLGLSLDEIRACLAERSPELGALLERHVGVLEPHGFEVPAGVFEYMARAGQALAATEPQKCHASFQVFWAPPTDQSLIMCSGLAPGTAESGIP